MTDIVDTWLNFYDCYGKACYLCGKQAVTKVDGHYVCRDHAPVPKKGDAQ